MSWTLKYGATEQTFEDWAITRPTLRRISQAPDLLSFDCPGQAFDAASKFPYGASITIYRNRTLNSSGAWTGGTIYFVGRRILEPREGAPESESNRYTFAGPWWYLDELIYQQNWKVYDGVTLNAEPRSHVFLNLDDFGVPTTTTAQIADAVAYAVAAAAPLQLGNSVTGLNVYFDEQRDISCGEVINKMLRWHPDAVTWFDYTTSPPTLHLRPRSLLSPVSFDLDAGDTIEVAGITRRDDLTRPAVVLKFEVVNEINGQAYVQPVTQKAPPSATGTEFGALVATIQLQGYSLQAVSAALTCSTIDAAHATEATRLLWWKKRLPYLASNRVLNLSIPAGSVVRETELPREVFEGQVAPWMNFTAGEETITAKATYQVQDANGNIVEEKVQEEINVRVNSTNATTGTFYSIASMSYGEAVPSGLATALYNTLSAVQYEGQLVLLEPEITGAISVGNVLNLTNGLAEWATMNALVQEITEDLDTGRTVVTFGPAKHLGIADLIELLRPTRNRFTFTNPGARVGGQSNGAQVALGKQTSRENSTSGAEAKKRLVILDGSGATLTQIDLDATAKTLLMTGPSGYGSIELEMTTGPLSETGTAGKDMKIREIDICVDVSGVWTRKKMRGLFSEVY